MAQWWSYLKGRPFYWVLDGSDPAASYYMLRYVVERPDSAWAVQAARLALQESPQVIALKATLIPDGKPRWTADYSGPLWALRLLAEWGYPGDDETIATCLDWGLEHSAQDSHPYASWLLLHLGLAYGFSEDERVQSLLSNAFKTLQSGARFTLNAEAATLLGMALATIPSTDLPNESLKGLESLLATFTPATLPTFAAYAYPTFDRPDGLTLAESALRLGLRGAWLEPWVAQITTEQNEQGLWQAKRVHLTNQVPDAPNRWISAKALYVLRSYYGE